MTKDCSSFLQSYSDFYRHFYFVVKDKGCSPQDLEFSDTPQGKNSWKIELTQPIHLSKWPIKGDAPYSSVDISVDAVFQCGKRNSAFVHTRSSVYLTYFDRDRSGKTAAPLENVRFDYHPKKGDDDHPLLHAHIFANGKPKSVPKSLEKTCSIDWSSLQSRLNFFRVPVPNMTLPSVLCCLVACHFGVDRVKQLLVQTKNARDSFPELALVDKQKELFFINSFAGSQWFERP